MVRDNPEHQTTSLAAFGPADNAHIEPQCSITPLVWMCVTGNIEAGKCNLVDTQDNFVNTELCMGQTGVSFWRIDSVVRRGSENSFTGPKPVNCHNLVESCTCGRCQCCRHGGLPMGDPHLSLDSLRHWTQMPQTRTPSRVAFMLYTQTRKLPHQSQNKLSRVSLFPQSIGSPLPHWAVKAKKHVHLGSSVTLQLSCACHYIWLPRKCRLWNVGT